jgi:hypothetical protein
LFLDFIKKRLEIYGLVVVAAGAIVVSVLGFQGKLALVQKDVETIKNEQLSPLLQLSSLRGARLR